jgi:hypothetical protein
MFEWRPGFKDRALSKAGETDDANSLEDFLWQVHEYTNEYIRFADTKAAFIVAASTALIGTSISSLILDSFLRKAPKPLGNKAAPLEQDAHRVYLLGEHLWPSIGN